MIDSNVIRTAARWCQRHLTPYDDLAHAVAAEPRARRAALAILGVFLAFGVAFIGFGLVDNKPTTASSGLVAAHRGVTMDFAGWLREGIWWRGQQTPTPLPYTIHGIWFALFGYSVRAILFLHLTAGACSGWLLHRVTARRFGGWSGALAMALYFTAPLCLYVIFSGWTFVWATLFLLLAIDLLDRATITRSAAPYLLAGLALGCAGMSRPENYMVAVLVVAFVDMPLRFRAALLALTFLYPVTQYIHNNLYLGDTPGLRILSDARASMSWTALLAEWSLSVWRGVVNRNFHPLAQLAVAAGVAAFGFRRRRFLAGVLLYFSAAFFAAYALRRISFNHEGYYYVHVVLAMPFLAALLLAAGRALVARAERWGLGGAAARRLLAGCLIGLLAAQAFTLRTAWRERAFYRVPEPVRELRDFLQSTLADSDRVALDYFTEVSWMLAEIECPGGRDLWFYNTSTGGEPRPRVNAARKDIRAEEFGPMNEWVRGSFERWADQRPPRYLVTQTDAAWQRERDRPRGTGHYRMFSLRPALGVDSMEGDPPGDATVVFRNPEFVVFELRG